MANRCDACGYYQSSTVPPKSDGLCRRYPPTQIAYAQTAQAPMTTYWPTVKNNDWCGEWIVIPPAADEGPARRTKKT